MTDALEVRERKHNFNDQTGVAAKINITDLSSHSTPQVCPEKLRKSGCISEEEVFAVTMLKISSYLLSHFHFSVTFLDALASLKTMLVIK